MTTAVRTFVTFRSSAFNTAEPRDHFFYPDNYGDDVCKAWMKQLQSLGLKTAVEPHQSESYWFFIVEYSGKKYAVRCGYRADDNTWISFVKFIPLIPFFAKKDIPSEVVVAMDKALKALPVKDVKWHTESDFQACNEDAGRDQPEH